MCLAYSKLKIKIKEILNLIVVISRMKTEYVAYCTYSDLKLVTNLNVLNVFIDIQTSKELIQMDTDKMMTYGTYTMDDEKLTQS